MNQIGIVETLNNFELIGHIYQTSDYSVFKRLDGNRSVKKSRISKISESMESVGNLNVPILVNEKFEVLDGQGRIGACMALGVPVKFTIQTGIGIDECRMLNAKSTNWTTMDYIQSDAERGEKWAIFMKEMSAKYQGMPIETIWYSLNKTFRRTDGSISRAIINARGISFTDEEYERAEYEIKYVSNFLDIPKKKTLCTRPFANAILMCSRIASIDKDRLNAKLHEYYMDIPSLFDLTECLKYFSEIYNRKAKKKINFVFEYEKLMMEKQK